MVKIKLSIEVSRAGNPIAISRNVILAPPETLVLTMLNTNCEGRVLAGGVSF